jgi:hypothetical protein
LATTITVAGSIGWSQAFVGFKGLAIGVGSEPAISTANIILQTIIGPPFSWNWNRASVTFTTTAGTQDYVQATTGFGFIEKGSYKIPAATITNTAATGGVATYTSANTFKAGDLVTVTGTTNGSGVFNITNQTVATATSSQFTVNLNASVVSAGDTGTATVGTTTEISEVFNILGTGNELGSPTKLAPQKDDNAGNITYRLLPIPDRTYTVEVIYQQRPTSLINNVSNTWAPIPDHYSYIYQWGFLALIYAYNNDSRWAQASQKFVAGLLGAAEGLEEEEKNIFQNAWLNTITEQQVTSAKAQQGVGSRQIE